MVLSTTNTNKEERAITFSDLWRIFLTALPLMIIVGILIVGVGYAYRKVTYRPEYTSEGSFLVMRDRTQTGEGDKLSTGGETQLALLLLQTCYDVVTSYDVYDQTAARLNAEGYAGESAKKIASAVRVTVNEKSIIIFIRATATDKDAAKRTLEVFMETAKEKVDTLMNNGNDFVSYCDRPRDAVVSSSFGMLRILLIALLGMIVVYGVYLILDLVDDRIRTGEDIADVAGLTLLGIIPDADTTERKYTYKYGRKYAKHYGRYGASGTQKKEG